MKKAIIIGAGFGGLSLASLLAQKGYSVTILEKNDTPGGRARVWKEKGFVFDMGPSWYLMPEVFDNFFKQFGKNREDYYKLIRLDPYYRVFFAKNDVVDITSDMQSNYAAFEKIEKSSSGKLKDYLTTAEYKYNTAMNEFIYKEYTSIFDFFNKRLMTEGLKLNIFSNLDAYVKKYFQDRKIRQLLEYAMVFLGNSPFNAPALYSIMSHIDFNLGVWYPDGGMGKVVDAFVSLAEENGVQIKCGEEVTKIIVENKKAKRVITSKGDYSADVVISNADYAHTETDLLDTKDSAYKKKYWSKKTLAPSMFLAYIGVNKKVNSLAHHSLHFIENWNEHFDTIFGKPSWPDKPCFYVGTPSRTDPTVAPAGMENIFFLVPIAPGLEDSDATREMLFDKYVTYFEGLIGEEIKSSIMVKRIYTVSDYKKDYNSYKGTALGMAHTLFQTAIFRPTHKSKKIDNLYYTGQYCHPGVGVPMVIISSQIVAEILGK